jgi:hypothetical protein
MQACLWFVPGAHNKGARFWNKSATRSPTHTLTFRILLSYSTVMATKSKCRENALRVYHFAILRFTNILPKQKWNFFYRSHLPSFLDYVSSGSAITASEVRWYLVLLLLLLLLSSLLTVGN